MRGRGKLGPSNPTLKRNIWRSTKDDKQIWSSGRAFDLALLSKAIQSHDPKILLASCTISRNNVRQTINNNVKVLTQTIWSRAWTQTNRTDNLRHICQVTHLQELDVSNSPQYNEPLFTWAYNLGLKDLHYMHWFPCI